MHKLFFKTLFSYKLKGMYVATVVTVIQYSRLQDGGVGENAAEFTPICVHVVVASPINSKPESQL